MRTFYFLMAFMLIHCGNSLPAEENPAQQTSDDSSAQQSQNPGLSSEAAVFTFEQIKAMDDEELSNTLRNIRDEEVIEKNKPFPHFKDLKNWKLHEFMSDKIMYNKLETVFYYIVLFGYLDQITPEQLQALGPEGLATASLIIKCLSPQQTKDLTPEQIAHEHVAYDLIAPQIAEMSVEQVNAIRADRFTPEEAKIISPEIITQMDYYSIPVDRLTKAQVEAITPEQISYTTEYGAKGINGFLPEQIPWLTLEQISAHPTEIKGSIYSAPSINSELLSAMSLEQTQVLSLEHSAEFTTDHLRALSLEQLYHFKENKKVARFIRFAENAKELLDEKYPSDYWKYSRYYVLSMMPEEFQNLTERQAKGFTHIWITLLSPSRIKQFPHYAKILTPEALEPNNHWDPAFRTYPITKEQFRAISVEQMPDLSLEFLRAILEEKIYWFTFDQLTHLTQEQLYMLFNDRFGPDIDMGKLFSIVYIAEQAGEKGKEWLRGPMREAVIKHLEDDCERSGTDRSCPSDEWLKFPDMPEYMEYRNPVPFYYQTQHVRDRGIGYGVGCDSVSSYISRNKKALALSKKEQELSQPEEAPRD